MAYIKLDLKEKILTLSEKYVTLDNLEERAMAQKDPALFLRLPFRILSGQLSALDADHYIVPIWMI